MINSSKCINGESGNKKGMRLMKQKHSLFLSATALLFMMAVSSWAADTLVTGDINGSQLYDSAEGIVFDDAILKPAANVTAISAFEVHLKPGTRIEAGARLVVSMKDKDGMDNRCEMTYFGDLSHDANSDDDGDQLTNTQECQLGTNPTQNNPDNDTDGLPDWWEVQYSGANLGLLNGRNGDADGDGVSNWVEYKLGSNPLSADLPGPGFFYEYDELGRVKKIQRIPSN